jgi:hypothetical protein
MESSVTCIRLPDAPRRKKKPPTLARDGGVNCAEGDVVVARAMLGCYDEVCTCTGTTLVAFIPFDEVSASYSTVWPSLRLLKPSI